jgi:phage tail tape-measure protein
MNAIRAAGYGRLSVALIFLTMTACAGDPDKTRGMLLGAGLGAAAGAVAGAGVGAAVGVVVGGAIGAVNTSNVSRPAASDQPRRVSDGTPGIASIPQRRGNME